MAFTPEPAGINVAADALAAAATHATVHSADPAGTAGSFQSSDARQAVSLSNTNGTITLSATEAFTGAPGAGATHVALWDDPAAGSMLGSFDLTGDQAFNAAGDYDVDGITITVG